MLAMDDPGRTASPFHDGEQAVQKRLGVREAIEPWARQVIRPCLPEQHRAFYRQLPFVAVGVDRAAGRQVSVRRAELRGDEHLVAHVLHGRAEAPLRAGFAVVGRRVEVVDAAFDRLAHDGIGLASSGSRAGAE